MKLELAEAKAQLAAATTAPTAAPLPPSSLPPTSRPPLTPLPPNVYRPNSVIPAKRPASIAGVGKDDDDDDDDEEDDEEGVGAKFVAVRLHITSFDVMVY